MPVISNLIVISLFLNALSWNLAQEVKIRNLFISIDQKLIFLIICYKRENFVSGFGHFFNQTRVKILVAGDSLDS